MATVVNVDVDRLRGGDGVSDRLLRRLEDGIQQRAAFDGTRRSKGERDEDAACGLHRLLPRGAGIARGEDVIQRNCPAFVAGQGRDGRGVGAGGGHVVQVVIRSIRVMASLGRLRVVFMLPPNLRWSVFLSAGIHARCA